MPAGVSWGQYIRYTVAAMVSVFAGSQAVHQYYRPLRDLDKYVEKELNNLPEHVRVKIRKELQDENVLK